MSDERFDRIESQLTQVIQAIGTMQQNLVVVEQKVTALGNNLDAVREDVISLRRRVDSSEGTLLVIIREGFRRQEDSIDDLNYDLSANERKTRRLSRRVSRLERKDSNE